jgi:hypothetical protein
MELVNSAESLVTFVYVKGSLYCSSVIIDDKVVLVFTSTIAALYSFSVLPSNQECIEETLYSYFETNLREKLLQH